MHFSGEMAAIGASLLWAINSLNFSMAGERVGSMVVNHVRLWIALGLLMVTHIILFGSIFPSGAEWYRFQWLGLSGIVGYAIGDAALFESLVLLRPRLAMTIITTNPIFAAIFSWIILGERLSLPQTGAIVVTLLGIAWVVSGHKTKNERNDEVQKKGKFGVQALGVALAFIGSLCQGVGMVLSKMGMAHGFSPISANLIRLAAGTVIIFLITLFQGKLREQVSKLSDTKALGYIVLGAFLGPVLGVVLALYSVNHVNVGVATTLTSLAPVFLIPISYFYYREHVTLQSVLGAIVVIAGSSSLFFL